MKEEIKVCLFAIFILLVGYLSIAIVAYFIFNSNNVSDTVKINFETTIIYALFLFGILLVSSIFHAFILYKKEKQKVVK